jgi:hypothetical protein
MRETSIGTSLFLVAAGAVLAFAVNLQSTAIDINTIGVILMVVGIIGLILSFIVIGTWTAASPGHDTYIVHDDPVTTPHEHRRVSTHDVVYENDDETTHVERVREVRR